MDSGELAPLNAGSLGIGSAARPEQCRGVLADHAVTAAHGRQAPSSSVKCAGICTALWSSTTMYSVSVPSSGLPRVERIRSLSGGPEIHPWLKIGATRSPTENRTTPGPSATTLMLFRRCGYCGVCAMKG